MDKDRTIPLREKLTKIFGVGPMGAVVSFVLLAVFVWADSLIKLPVTQDHAGLMKVAGTGLVLFGLGLHSWSFFTLRHWWVDDALCTRGPFRYFRHPMYAAWITFVSLGVALYLNSWLYFLWVFLLHVFWTGLVKKEETAMTEIFGDAYRDYARRTGRFIPKVSNPDMDDEDHPAR